MKPKNCNACGRRWFGGVTTCPECGVAWQEERDSPFGRHSHLKNLLWVATLLALLILVLEIT